LEISTKNIGLLATQFTINTKKYDREIEKLSLDHTLYSIATPELAGFVEK
jgi:glutamate racemase